MKNLLCIITGIFVLSSLFGCSPQPSMTVTTNPGSCPGGQSNAPYCMAVTLQNGTSGQSFISSTSFPFTSVSVSVSGASNVLSPSSNSKMDPNGCTTSSIQPGASCTFYLQINQEQYSVNSVIPITITINYNVNNGLSAVIGGSGGSTYTYSFTINEYSNLYAAQQNDNIYTYGNNSFGGVLVESQSSTNIQSVAVDNSSFGYVWFATNQGMYWFGNGNTSGNTSYSTPNGATAGISNIFTSQPSPFESSSNSPTTMYGVSGSIYPFTFGTMSWSSSALATAPTGVINNVNAVSSSGSYMILTNGTIVYVCPTSGTGGTCNQEGLSRPSDSAISDLGFVSASTGNYTGLYIATKSGLFAESGIQFPNGAASAWDRVKGAGVDSAQLASITTDDQGNLYAGGATGNIWLVRGNSAPLVANLLTTISGGSPVTALVFDNFGSTIYATSGITIYQCPVSLGVPPSATCTAIGTMSNGTMIGLVIGSSLSN